MKVDPECVSSAAGYISQQISAQLMVQPGVVVKLQHLSWCLLFIKGVEYF